MGYIKGTWIIVEKEDGTRYSAVYCGQKDGYFIIGTPGEDFCIKSFTSVVTDFDPSGCKSFRFVKPKYVYSLEDN